MITPAIQTLTILETCFADFKGDLTNLSQETKQNDGDHLGTDAIEKVKVKKIIKHWNYLASEGESTTQLPPQPRTYANMTPL